MKLKREVLDELDKLYDLELPEKLVEAEFQQIWSALTREMEREKKTFEQEETIEEATREEYRRIAERRVKLGLVLGTIGEQTAITYYVGSTDDMRASLKLAACTPTPPERAARFPVAVP